MAHISLADVRQCAARCSSFGVPVAASTSRATRGNCRWRKESTSTQAGGSGSRLIWHAIAQAFAVHHSSAGAGTLQSAGDNRPVEARQAATGSRPAAPCRPQWRSSNHSRPCLTALLQHLERSKIARVDRPHPARAEKMRTRHVPASIRREVWKRDDGRCAFVGTDGRCGEQGFLEFHHVVPFAEGGETSAANVQLRCPAQNGYETTEHFGVSLLREASTEYELSRCGLGPDPRREKSPEVFR